MIDKGSVFPGIPVIDWRHMVVVLEFFVEKSLIFISYFMSNLRNRQIAVFQKKSCLEHAMGNDELLKSYAGMLFDIGTQIIRMETKQFRNRMQSDRLIVGFHVSEDQQQNFIVRIFRRCGNRLFLIHAEKLRKQYNHVSIHDLVAADSGIIIFTEKLLDDKVNVNIRMTVEDHMLLFVLAFQKRVDQETGDQSLSRKPGQKARCKVFFSHIDCNDNIIFR